MKIFTSFISHILNMEIFYADAASDTDFTDPEDSPSFYTPRLRRRQKRRRRRNQPHYFGYIGNEEVDYLNNLPEEGRLVEIRSNIWGTKFKIHGVDLSLPPLLGQVSARKFCLLVCNTLSSINFNHQTTLITNQL